MANKYVRGYVEIKRWEFVAKLTSVPIQEVKVIFCMDWMSHHGVLINCWQRKIQIKVTDIWKWAKYSPYP